MRKNLLIFLLGFASSIACIILLFKKIIKVMNKHKWFSAARIFYDSVIPSIKNWLVSMIDSLFYGDIHDRYYLGPTKVTYYKPYKSYYRSKESPICYTEDEEDEAEENI